jgi:hypothetical protein
MSPENVALLQRFTDAPLMSETEIRSYFHADVEFLPLRAATEGAYHGIAGIERFIADNKTVFEKFEPRWEYLDLDDRVLAWGAIHVRARQSGIDTDIPVGAVVEFREGRIVRWEVWDSKEKALKARTRGSPRLERSATSECTVGASAHALARRGRRVGQLRALGVEIRGHVVLVNFWTLTCIKWVRTEPYFRVWSQAY